MADRKYGVKRQLITREYIYPDYKYDYSIYRYLVKLKPELFVPETIKYIWLRILIITKKLYLIQSTIIQKTVIYIMNIHGLLKTNTSIIVI